MSSTPTSSFWQDHSTAEYGRYWGCKRKQNIEAAQESHKYLEKWFYRLVDRDNSRLWEGKSLPMHFRRRDLGHHYHATYFLGERRTRDDSCSRLNVISGHSEKAGLVRIKLKAGLRKYMVVIKKGRPWDFRDWTFLIALAPRPAGLTGSSRVAVYGKPSPLGPQQQQKKEEKA